MSDWKGKVVVLTGAAGGIGAATARLAHASGASVVITDIDANGAERLASELGDRALGFGMDVTSRAANERMIERAIEKFGGVHGVFLNAGVEGRMGELATSDDSTWEQVLAVNLHGVRLGLAASVPALRAAGGGSVVITSSVAGLRGSAGLSPYVTSKHAVMGMARSAAAELGPHGIRVNTLNPGPVDNRMMRSIEDQANPGHGDEVKKMFDARCPLGRYVTNEECARMALFLLSDAASGCTGAAFVVDAGFTAQ